MCSFQPIQVVTVYQTDPSGPDSEITQDESIVADAVQAGSSDGFDLASATASPVGEAGGAQSQVWSLTHILLTFQNQGSM